MPATTSGLICAHHHLYSALARGMPPPPVTPRRFGEILEQIWWRLDCALDLEMIEWSARLGALEALECGTTAIIDHHESPNAIEGSLDVISRACADVGVRVLCAYGVTDRHRPPGDGPAAVPVPVPVTPQPSADVRPDRMTDGARRGLAENERFLRAGGRGYVGVHAAFTCADETLEAAADLARGVGVGVHIHVGEGPGDADAARRLERLAADDWLLVHCVWLDRDLPGTIAHNPRSNMNNGVGYAAPSQRPNRVVLGTDGIGAAMLEEFGLAYVRHREADLGATPDAAWQWLQNGYALVPEAADDRVTWSYEPINAWHVAFTPGIRALRVEVGGEVVLEDGVATRVDPAEIRAKAAEQSARLFARL